MVNNSTNINKRTITCHQQSPVTNNHLSPTITCHQNYWALKDHDIWRSNIYSPVNFENWIDLISFLLLILVLQLYYINRFVCDYISSVTLDLRISPLTCNVTIGDDITNCGIVNALLKITDHHKKLKTTWCYISEYPGIRNQTNPVIHTRIENSLLAMI
jgi:hypothetical protein